jgi:hypothetical protein
MVNNNPSLLKTETRVKTYRWYYYIALTQFLLYFIVPIIIFPGRIIKNVEVISALTFGTVIGLFFLLVSLLGLFLDKERRVVYVVSILFVVIYLTGVTYSWLYLERLDFLLR